jgi:sugar fermentation stimulation protein A
VNGAQRMEVAEAIDPQYAKTLVQALNEGIEVIAWRAKISSSEIVLETAIPCLQDLQEPEPEG